MKRLVQTSIAILIVGCLMITGFLSCISSSQALDSDPQLAPAPSIFPTHDYNVPVDALVNDSGTCSERWSIALQQGDVQTLIMARNFSQGNQISVDYTLNTLYTVGDTEYIAQFMIMYVTIIVDQQTIEVPLKTCDAFELTYSSIKYNGTVPTFDCNITYEHLRVYSDPTMKSTFDLTLLHHVAANWNQTDIKVEALFDFNNTKLYDQSTGNELDAGTPFTAEVHYGMMVHKAHAFETDGPVIPTGHTNESLEYGLMLDNGSPLTLSKMNMSNAFSVFNGTGSYPSMGYSSMNYAPQSHVIHGFPGLIYKETQSIKSDPEITVYHNRVTENQINGNNNPNGFPLWMPLAMVGAIGVVGAIGAVLVVKRRKKPEE